RLRVLVPVGNESQLGIFPRPVVLPLVMEHVLVEPEINRPVVDVVGPFPNLLAHLVGDQLRARNDKILQAKANALYLHLSIDLQVRKLVEVNVPSFYRTPIHDLSRDVEQSKVDSTPLRLCLDDIVETHLPFPAEDVEL